MSQTQQINYRYPLQAWVVVLAASLFFFYEFIQMNMPNSMSDNLMRAFDIDSLGVGNLSAAYFYADIVFILPAGFLLDRFSTRRLILIGIAVCALGSVGFALAHNYWLAFAMRLITGAGAAFTLLSAVRLASRWFPSEKLALVTGIIVTIAMLGGWVAQTPMAMLIELLGWRHAVLCDGIIGVLIFFIIFFVVQDYPANYQQQHQQNLSHLRSQSVVKNIQQIFSNRQNWTSGLYTSLLNLPIFIIGGLWGTAYLEQVSGFSKAQASFVSSMVFIGTIIGSPLIGLLSDKLGLRRLPMIAFALLSLAVMVTVLWASHLSYPVLLVLFLLLGIFTSAQILGYPVISESNPKLITSGAMSIASVVIMAGGAIFQPVVGWLLRLDWDGKMLANQPLYSAQDFHQAFMLLPVAFIAAVIISFLVRETYCRAFAE